MNDWLEQMRVRGGYLLLISAITAYLGFYLLFGGVQIDLVRGLVLIALCFGAAAWSFIVGINKFWSDDDRG